MPGTWVTRQKLQCGRFHSMRISRGWPALCAMPSSLLLATMSSPICSLQKSKGYFFAISFVILIVVLFFSWQLFRQSSYQPIRELNRIGMTEQLSKTESMNSPMDTFNSPLDSFERLTPLARIIAASQNNISLSQLPLLKKSQKLFGKTSRPRQVILSQMSNQRNFVLNSQRSFMSKKNFTYNSVNQRAQLDNMTKGKSSGRRSLNGTNSKIGIRSKDSSSVQFNVGGHFMPVKISGTVNSNKLRNPGKKINLPSNSIKFSSNTQVNTKLIRPRLSTKFVDDIHNFHAPDRQKILSRRNHLEDALNQAAMEPQDHILTGKLCQDCQALGFRYDLNVEDICQGDIYLLIIVESPPSNRMARDAIRNTWGMVSQVRSSEVRVVFLLGKSRLNPENQLAKVEHWHKQDVIQIDFMDAYANLTYKTLSGLHWVHTFCPNAKYVMKTDDDMYVNTPLILKMLRATPKTKFLGGYCWGISTPHRDSRSKWYVPYEMYSAPTFPPMCSGTGYILSRDLVDSVINVSVNIKFFYLEDVHIALCLEKYQISPVNIQGFSNMLVSFDSCQFRNYVLTSHGHSPYELRESWPLIQTCPQKELTPHQLFMPIPFPEVD